MASFDDMTELLEEEDNEGQEFQPIWALKNPDKEAIHKWLVNEVNHLLKLNKDRHSNMIENLLIYKGVQFEPNNEKTISDFFDISRNRKRTDKQHLLLINHLFDLTETIVSRSTRNSPQPEVLPANSEEISDRNAAKSVLQILNHIAYINRLAQKDIRMARKSLISGVSYMSVLWNKDLGDIDPAWLEAQEVNFKDEEGNDILDENDKKFDAKKPRMTGEVEQKAWDGWKVLLENKDDFDDVDYCFSIEPRIVQELEEDYPKLKGKIKPLENTSVFDSQKMAFRKLRNEALVFTFYHRPTKYFPKGMEASFTLNELLNKEDYPYDHKKLPFVRLTDVDIESELHPESFYEQVKNIQWRHNQMTSDIVTNIRLCSRPKWLVPKGRCNIKNLANAITIVQYSGNIAPRLESPQTTSSEVFAFRRELKEDMEQVSTVTGVARRNPPSGLTASVSLKFMSELEAERVSVAVSKHNEYIRDVYFLTMSVAGTFYDESDGRTLRVLGNDEQYHNKDMEIANLSKPYDVIIQNTGKIVESRSVKEAKIFDVLDRKPDLLSSEQIIEALDMGTMEKVTTILTESLRSAEAENEGIFKNEEILDPAEYEDHITHWKSHVQKLQSFNLKHYADPESIAMLQDHIAGHEFLMIEKAKTNALLQDKLSGLSLFPLYYSESGFVPKSKEHQRAEVQGAHNRGEPTDVVIAGEEPIDQISKDERVISEARRKGNKKR